MGVARRSASHGAGSDVSSKPAPGPRVWADAVDEAEGEEDEAEGEEDEAEAEEKEGQQKVTDTGR